MPLGSDSLKNHQVSDQAGSLREGVASPQVRLPDLQEEGTALHHVGRDKIQGHGLPNKQQQDNLLQKVPETSLAMRNSHNNLGKKHLEATKGNMVKDHKTTPSLLSKDCNHEYPISSNPLHSICEMFTVEMLGYSTNSKKLWNYYH